MKSQRVNSILTDRFDITNTYYEYVGEHDNYVAVPLMEPCLSLICSAIHLVYSENTQPMLLADRFSGWSKRAQVIQSLWSIPFTRELKPLAK